MGELFETISKRLGGATLERGPALSVGISRGYTRAQSIVDMVAKGIHSLGVVTTSPSAYHPVAAWKPDDTSHPHGKPQVVPAATVHG